MGLKRTRSELGEDRRIRCSGRHLPHGDAAELDDITRFQLALLADPDHDHSRQVETRGGNDVEARAAFAGKAVCGGRTANEIPHGRERTLSCRTQLYVLFAEHNKNTARVAERRKTEFEGGGHEAFLWPCPLRAGPWWDVTITRL